MDITGYASGQYGEPIQVVNNTTSNESSGFNGRDIKIVVAARQYRDGVISGRGYGDIASGVRELEYVRKIFP